jgi:hypothetical protein
MENKINQPNLSSRRKFMWGFGILSLFSAATASLGIPFLSKKKSTLPPLIGAGNKTIKMLTEDGKLVEISASLMTSNRKKVTDEELKNWIKK